MSAFHTHFVEQFSVGFGLPRENSSIIIFKRYSIAKTVNIGVFFFQNAKNMWIATAPNATAGIHFTAILFARFSRTRSPRVCFFPPSERLRDVPMDRLLEHAMYLEWKSHIGDYWSLIGKKEKKRYDEQCLRFALTKFANIFTLYRLILPCPYTLPGPPSNVSKMAYTWVYMGC